MSHDEDRAIQSGWAKAWDAMSRDHPQAQRRPLWQFKLRTLMLVMFGAACFFGGWMANEVRHQRDRQSTLSLPPPISLPPPTSANIPAPAHPIDDLFGPPTRD